MAAMYWCNYQMARGTVENERERESLGGPGGTILDTIWLDVPLSMAQGARWSSGNGISLLTESCLTSNMPTVSCRVTERSALL